MAVAVAAVAVEALAFHGPGLDKSAEWCLCLDNCGHWPAEVVAGQSALLEENAPSVEIGSDLASAIVGPEQDRR